MRRAKLLFLLLCKWVGAFRLAKWLTRRHLKILCYHGFEMIDESEFRPSLFIAPSQFDGRLSLIAKCGLRVMPLRDAIDSLYAGTLPQNSVVITIDDGFHSVFRLAAPRLLRSGFPASVYVTTYYVDHANPVFRLAVQYMFWKTTRRQCTLEGLPGSVRDVVDLTDAAQAESAMWECIQYGERHCNEEVRVKLCQTLGERLAVSYDDLVRSRILHLMTPEELRSLAAMNIGIELHTHRHRFPSDDELQAKREIADNRAALTRMTGNAPDHFCYPSGLWTRSQSAWLDSIGVRSSTTCLPGLNSSTTPRHALRRFLDGANIHPLEFEAALCGFSDLLRELRDRLRRNRLARAC